MSLVLDLPAELESELAAETSRLGLPLSEYVLRLLAGGRAPSPAPRTGAELLAYWQGEGLIGTRQEIADNSANAGMRRVEVDAEFLFSVINDAINVYVREVLVLRGFVNDGAYFNDPELVALQHRIANQLAKHWTVCWKNDDVPEGQAGE
jgi:hypothetical protein